MVRKRREAGIVPALPRGLRALVDQVEYAVWRRVGEDCLGQMIAAGLPKEAAVLDIGCGTGRICWPLTRYLGPRAAYLGVDVRREAIEFCRVRVAPGDARFRFERVDLRHPVYNPSGRLDAERWSMSKLGRFDFVILVSVLNHLEWEQTVHYLQEIRGLLSPGGRAFVTCYLYSPGLVRARGPRFDDLFPFRAGEVRFNERDFNYAWPERSLRAACANAGLEFARPALYGDWSAPPVGAGGPPHDVVLLRAAR